MAKKKVHHEDHVDETWLIPYSDMLTLLLALFIVMFAMSKIDQEKFQKVSSEFNTILSGGSGIMEGGNGGGSPLEGSDGSSESGGEANLSNASIEENKMQDIKQLIDNEIKKNGYSDSVDVEVNEGGLEISMQDVILFNSAEASVLSEGYPLLMEISSMLKDLDNDVRIIGHTDNLPINNEAFRSNWDLSAMRAINVMNFMVDSGGMDSRKVSIQAYADQRPRFDNSTAEGRAKNRRVEIIIVRKYTNNEQGQ